MLTFTGQGKSFTCDGVSHRDFLQVSSLRAVGWSLADQQRAHVEKKIKDGHDDCAVIMIFNLGAPSQLDCFDLKPEAPAEIRGPFKPIATKAPGLEISEIFPQHAKRGQTLAGPQLLPFSCCRAQYGSSDDANRSTVFQSVESPHAGCILEYLQGRKTDLPAHVVLLEKMGRTGQFVARAGCRFSGKSF